MKYTILFACFFIGACPLISTHHKQIKKDKKSLKSNTAYEATPATPVANVPSPEFLPTPRLKRYKPAGISTSSEKSESQVRQYINCLPKENTIELSARSEETNSWATTKKYPSAEERKQLYKKSTLLGQKNQRLPKYSEPKLEEPHLIDSSSFEEE